MYYLIQPDGHVKWLDLPSSLVRELLAAEKVDLGKLEWKASELPFSAELVRLALRHGIPTSIGLALDGGDVSTMQRAREIRQLQAESIVNRAKLEPTTQAIDAWLEQSAPGQAAARARINKAADDSIEEAALEAEEDAAELLSGDPQPYLVAYWRELGGPLLSES